MKHPILHFTFGVCLTLLADCILAQNPVPGACALVPGSKTCIDTTPCKTDAEGNTLCLAGVNGPSGAWSLPDKCWQYSHTFACAGHTSSTCTPYANNKACAIVSSTCSDTIPSSGACAQYDNKYSCKTQEQKTGQVWNCTSGLFNTYPQKKPDPRPTKFAEAAVAVELIHEASTYNTQGNNFFAGVREQCKKGWGGIKDCCKSTAGAQPNSAIMNMVFSTGASVVKYAGEKAIDIASPYIFDAMYQSGPFTAGLMSNLAAANSSNIAQNSGHLLTGTTFASNGLALGAYGFTYGTGSFEVYKGTSLIAGNIDLSESLGLGASDGFVSFNPYVFAATVALQALQDLGSCEQGEQMLSLHKGASLSVFVEETCSARIPILGTCIEWTDHYCSFNSVLSKIVNTQGKPQLGLNVSDCSGIRPDQLGSLDFTKIDFSEFANQQASQAQSSLPTNIKNNYTPVMQGTSKGSAQSISPALPSYPTR